MTKSKSTKRALLMSGLALFACISMLVGSTFAWFTDSVTSGRNVIAAGNLDVELYAGGVKVDATTVLFDDIELWEPGAVVYENLQIANEGTLALKYQLSVNVIGENDLNGHKLSEVVKVAIIDKVADTATRADILAAAKASSKKGELSNLYLTGDLEAGKTSAEQAVVIYWEPTDHDNDYNANNGQKTSDGEPLYIEFGVQLEATQKMSEEDSFGKDYDKFASILPKAKVNNVSKQYPSIDATWGINGADAEVELDVAMQFQPNESYEAAQSSAYRYWHVDFVVKADKPVPANSVALAGYYQAWCGPLYDDGSGWNLNDGKWVALINDGMDIAAGEEIRLVEGMGGGNISVNYEEICNYGNDGTGFLCGAADLTGENAGTTITVELRMYETTKAPGASSGTANTETGNYKVIGTISHTFKNEVASAADLKAQLAAGNDVTLSGDITLNDEPLTITGDVTIDMNGHTISGVSTASTTSYLVEVKAGASLTLTGNGTISFGATKPDTNWGGEGQPAFPGYANNTIKNLGKLTIDGVTVENLTALGGASYAIDCYQGSELTVNSGVINGHGKCAIRMFCNSNTQLTKVTVNGGTITGKRGIWVQLPGSNKANVRPVELIVNGGKIIATSDADCAIYSYSYGDSFDNTKITITGGEFFGDVAFGGGAKDTQETVTVTGGTFHGELGRYLANEGWADIAKP